MSLALVVAATTTTSFAEPIAEPVEADAALVPPGEAELVASHPVEAAGEAFEPGKGFRVKSSDGLFSLRTRLRLQLLAGVENAPKAPAEMGMTLRRARIVFDGHVYGPHNRFKTELAVSPRDLRMTTIGDEVLVRESPLLSWYLEFDYLRDLTVRTGQYKIPFSRQRVISSGNLAMVGRAMAQNEFNLDRDVGLDVRSKDLFGLGLFRYYLGVYNGDGRSPFANGDSSLLYLARFEVLPFGFFSDYSEADFERLSRPGVSLGLAYGYSDESTHSRVNRGGRFDDGGTGTTHNVTADMVVKYRGVAFASEFFWRQGAREPGDALDEDGMPIATEALRQGYGWFAQLGYLLPQRPVEVTVRGGQVRGRGESALADQNDVGVALSYYMARHPLKLQGDVFQLWDAAFSEGTTTVQLQLQSSF